MSAALREVPTAVHPGRDEQMAEAEQRHCRALVSTHSAAINFALASGDETAIEQGVPPPIRYRCMAWAALHRSAMTVAHYVAMVKASDEEAAVAAQQFADEFRDLILKQLPNSRESCAEIEAKARGDQ